MIVKDYEIIEFGDDLNDYKTPGVYIYPGNSYDILNSPHVNQTGQTTGINIIQPTSMSFVLYVYESRPTGYANGYHIKQVMDFTMSGLKYERIYVTGNDTWFGWIQMKSHNENMFSYNSNTHMVDKYILDFDSITHTTIVDTIGVDEIINPPFDFYHTKGSFQGFIIVYYHSNEGLIEWENNMMKRGSDSSMIQIYFPVISADIVAGAYPKYRFNWYNNGWSVWRDFTALTN